jgi:hypothetical protein
VVVGLAEVVEGSIHYRKTKQHFASVLCLTFNSAMKTHILLLTFCIPSMGSGQDYTPLRSGMKRAFADATGPGLMYSLSLDSVAHSGTDTTLNNYFHLNDSISHYQGCGYLGGDECNRTTAPSWTGRDIVLMANGSIRFHTVLGDTLDLVFPTSASDTAWFYTDDEQRFGMRLMSADTASFIGALDSARFYHVVHVDVSGEVINSVLNEAPITVGKVLGLVEFLQVDSFPSVQRRLRMIGDGLLQVGLYCITDASIHDYSIGDEIQYWHSEYSVFPTTIVGYFRKETILSRSDTPTSVTYEVQREQFGGGDPGSSGMVTLTYSKLDTVAKIPFESFEGVSRIMFQVDHCGSQFWHYEFDPDNTWSPCVYGPCWSPEINGYGPNPDSFAFHIIGVGSGHLFSQSFLGGGGGLQYVSHSTFIRYFQKNGAPCGTEVIVGIEETVVDPHLLIAPNPTKGILSIGADLPIEQVRIVDLQGRLILSTSMRTANGMLDLGAFPDGMYVLHVEFLGGGRAAQKVLIQH